MGHAISFGVAGKKSDILSQCKEYAFNNVDRGENRYGDYHGNVTICESHPICKDYEDAVETIRRMARDTFYHDFAVRFYDTDSVTTSKKIQTQEARYKDSCAKAQAYENAHSVKNHKSSQIGCKKCGSKITISYLKREICPVCGSDLRAEYILEKLSTYAKEQKEIQAKIREEKQKAASKAPVKWCYKVEVHT